MSILLDLESIDLASLHLSPPELDYVKTNGKRALFENTFQTLCKTKYPNGLPGIKARVMYRFLNKMDAGEGKFEIEQAEADLLKEVFTDDSVAIKSELVRLYGLLRDYFEVTLKPVAK